MSKPPAPPPEAAQLFKSYLTDEPRPIEELHQDLNRYLKFVERVCQVNSQVDDELALKIAANLRELLVVSPPEKFKYAQAATRYFIEDEDAEEDLISATGFEDDIAILNSVAHHLGRNDLQILPQ